jgi:transcriptional regulator with XRE-family HTH domain
MGEVSPFGVRLKMLRTKAGLTRSALARKAGASRPSIIKVEEGDRKGLSMETTVKIAAALGLSVDRLISDTLDPPESEGKEI